MSPREDYEALVGSSHAAIAFENEVLSIGEEHLPPSARAVLKGKRPTAAYWRFLSRQFEAMRDSDG